MLCIYLYAFFLWQPDRSYEHLVAVNADLEEAHTEYLKQREEKQLEDKENGREATSTWDTILWVCFLMLAVRTYLRLYVYPRLRYNRIQRLQRGTHSQFRSFADRLNRLRSMNGEQPLSAESLRLFVDERDFDGDDYEALLRFDEEAGPAVEAAPTNLGARRDEIERLPLRTVLSPSDELLRPDAHHERPCCPVCLEQYELNDDVRSLACSHTYHRRCIDQWLPIRATCPVCKNSTRS